MSARWLDIAGQYLGQRETSGPNDSPWIRRMLASLNVSWLLGQPWCGIFMARVMKEAGIDYPKAYYRAREWENWGFGLTSPCVGCIAVTKRPGGYHVGIVVGRDGWGNYILRGGNQGDAVRDSVFLKDRGWSFRWPTGQPLPVFFVLPLISNSAPVSTNEA